MPTALTIVTGASRGLGLALAEQLLARGDRVLAISRQAPALCHERLSVWHADLAEPAAAARQLGAWLQAVGVDGAASVTLINNAGVITPPAPLAQTAAADLARAVRVGLEAPLLLSAAFLKATAGWTRPRRLLMISSGLGRRAMASAAAYCAVKAGLDHLARALALEQALEPNGARVVSIAPGVVDTDMQLQLRSADGAAFPDRANFVGLQAKGLLSSPAAAAASLLARLERADFGSQAIADVRDD
ncbi:MAG: SDR family NAD(P)-dependent oxidoreductase [Burkholderiales bacterium]|nr:SDR family NAD(P)-dependent oxidoreductase [Burkholderiales bacterium]MDE2453380.1 SDR family NAD(P)-dependent oxidoreductase [Burkholderiales bacterium]